MAFRPLSSKESLPRCERCGAGNPRVVSASAERHRWLCAACEYSDAYPDAPMVPAHPQVRRPLPLQRETLFDGEASPRR